MRIPAIAAAAAFALSATTTLAQVGEQGRIATRSDVRMSIEGLPGTGGPKLDALAKTLGKPLSEVKHCYAEVVKERPEVVGTVGVDIELPEKGAPKVKAPDLTPQLKPISRCIDRAFGKLDVKDVPRPAGARVVLELTNSSASTVSDVREREEAASKVEVKRLPDGGYESNGKSTQGEVSYRVTASDPNGADVVTRVHQAVRDALPSLFDCRRRAGKKGSPEGELVLKVALKPADKADVDVLRFTVPTERAPFCVDNALTQTLVKIGKGKAEVTIRFAP